MGRLITSFLTDCWGFPPISLLPCSSSSPSCCCYLQAVLGALGCTDLQLGSQWAWSCHCCALPRACIFPALVFLNKHAVLQSVRCFLCFTLSRLPNEFFLAVLLPVDGFSVLLYHESQVVNELFSLELQALSREALNHIWAWCVLFFSLLLWQEWSVSLCIVSRRQVKEFYWKPVLPDYT